MLTGQESRGSDCSLNAGSIVDLEEIGGERVSNKKWTPGPWKLLGSFDEGFNYPGNAWLYYKVIAESVKPEHGRSDNDICVLQDNEYIYYKNPEDQNANAQLIAAAPDLYEALEAIITTKRKDVFLTPDMIHDGIVALAKARGEYK